MKLWDAETGDPLRALGPQPDWAQALAFSPDGRQLAVGRYDGSIGIYDAASGRPSWNHSPTTRWHDDDNRDAPRRSERWLIGAWRAATAERKRGRPLSRA